jgi:hypothetical protein
MGIYKRNDVSWYLRNKGDCEFIFRVGWCSGWFNSSRYIIDTNRSWSLYGIKIDISCQRPQKSKIINKINGVISEKKIKNKAQIIHASQIIKFIN